MPDRDTVISRIETICEICKTNKWRTEFDSDIIYPILTDTLALLKEQDAVEPYIAGSGESFETAGTWWYECGHCNKQIDPYDKFCRHCGKAVKWDA
jgi:hypothetical protein